MSSTPATSQPNGTGHSASDTPTPTLREEPVDIPLKEKSPGNPNPEAEPDEDEGGNQKNAQGKRASDVSAVDEDKEDVLIVDWEGPDDPENPKK